MSTNSATSATLFLACLALIVSTMSGCPGSTPMFEGLVSSMPLSLDRTGDVQGQPPTIQGPLDMTVECDGAGNSSALNAWLADVTFTQGCGGAVLTDNFKALSNKCGATGSVTVTWTVTDSCNQSASHTATFAIVDTTDPTLTPPAAISVTCGEPGTTASLTAWLAGAGADDTCGATSMVHERGATPFPCMAQITWTATDECGNTTSASAIYTTVGDTTAPTITLNGEAELTLECGVDEFVDPGATVLDDCDALIVGTTNGSVDTHTPGDYTLTYGAIDACGNVGTSVARLVHVVDTLPPAIVAGAPRELWPPNHRTVSLTLEDIVDVVDACQGRIDVNAFGRILELYSDEPDNSTGDGNTTGDIAINSDFSFTVRAERRGGGNGRVYGVRFEVTDAEGNIAELTAFVHVPHDQSGDAAIDDGISAGQSITPG